MDDHSKLTVAKLKALCKEKGLKNYSKLSKPALLAKLAAVGTSFSDTVSSSTSSEPWGNGKAKSKQKEAMPASAKDVASNVPTSSNDSSISGSTSTTPSHPGNYEKKSNAEPSSQRDQTKPSRSVYSSSHITNISPAVISLPASSGSKRSSDTAFPISTVSKPFKASKKTKITPPPSTSNIQKAFKVPKVPLRENRSSSPAHGMGVCSSELPQSVSQAQPSNPSARATGLSSHVINSEFIPQTPSRPINFIRHEPPQRPHKPKFNRPRPTNNPSTQLPGQMPLLPRPPSSMDSPDQTMEVLVLPMLKNITMPPSMSQRKRLPMLSLAMSRLGEAERMACVLVSKLFRYAVYISAQDKLNRYFSGERLSRLISSLSSKGVSLAMINLWPYLRLRQQEVSQRKRMFARGWVPRFFRELGSEYTLPMSEPLWASPACEEQLLVVLRFIQTRICFALSFHALGSAALKWVTSTVVDAQEVIKNEVWSITAVEPDAEHGDTETFYILYHTCEVIGHPPTQKSTSPPLPDTGNHSSSLLPNDTQSRSSRIPLRADWSSYIALRLPAATRHLHAPLIEHICGTNTDDFEGGVATVWLKRMESLGEEGRAKRQVTERYVLGCVVGNSVSGEYRSTARMALEFAGVPEEPEPGFRQRHTIPRVNLFIPERHNVESVHFTNTHGLPLHPDLAVVQTAGRQDGSFVMRENGVVIGEDETVPEVWMKLLGCDENGVESK